jgi:hypothetical protein
MSVNNEILARSAELPGSAQLVVVSDLNIPTSIVFDSSGRLYVAESGLAFGSAPTGGRVFQILENGTRRCIVENLRPPVNGLSVYKNDLYISEGGNPGRISVVDINTLQRETVIDNLPGGGNYHTNMAIMGDDGWLYFGQGALTNSGVVGPDSAMMPWLKEVRHPCDIPGCDISLSGWNGRSENEEVSTGAFQEYGIEGRAGQTIKGALPCTAAIMRCRPDGSALELVAWGLRNPYGISFNRQGDLIAIDIGINDRGSRPIGNVPDCLYQVKQGQWYGWPDFAAGIPVTAKDYKPQRGPLAGQTPSFLLGNHEQLGAPAKPLHTFVKHAAPTKFCFEPNANRIVLAMFGDKLPVTGPPGPRAGRCVGRLDMATGKKEILLGHTFSRPIDVCFGPDNSLYVLDFGHYEMRSPAKLDTTAGSGVLYKIETPIFGDQAEELF